LQLVVLAIIQTIGLVYF